MDKWISLVSDLCVIIFDLMLYTRMTTLRGDKARNRKILYAGCTVIVAFYAVAVMVLSWPAAFSAFACMTLPSLALFWALCKYRDTRFFLTFCLVDTVSMIVAYLSRYVGMVTGDIGGVLAIVVMLALFFIIYRAAKPYFQKYREALEFIESGWKQLTCSAVLIYITMIFCAVYPIPLVERPEYGPSYLAMSIMILSFYMVFLINIAVTKKAYDQSIRLKEQQKWFRAAYVDALTEVPNRAAYMEKIYELECMEDKAEPVAIMIMDLDHFKEINDTHGHIAGDEVLKRAAKLLWDCFSDENSTVYRIGGDEFAVISVGAKEDEIVEKLKTLEEVQSGDIPYGISAGYSFVDRAEDNAVNRAFSRADAMMYGSRRRKNIFDDR